ncbi:MAG: hypothetical protein E7545_00520 [Ruminococcaceae bacterium]|nr:hypothetical protein [Oscillospiraceae bacterium]
MKTIIIFLMIFLISFSFNGCIKTNITSPNNDIQESEITNEGGNAMPYQEYDNILLSVLNNEKPFINAKDETVYLKNYKPLSKYPEDTDYFERENVFVPSKYAFVDLDKDGQNELVISELPNGDTYLILHKLNDKVYGYSLYVRWFEELKVDGTFLSSGGAFSHNYNNISFDGNKYNISTFAKFDFVGDEEKPSSNKYGFEPNYDKSVFEIDGKKVSFKEIVEFEEEWENRPEVDWIKLK